MKILCRTKKFKGTIIASLLGALALGLLLAPGLEAQENDCDALMQSLSRGEFPAIVINPADETVKIVTSKGACSESIEAWSNRESQPPADKKPAPKPAPEPASEPVTVTPQPVPASPAESGVFKELTPRQVFTPEPDTGPVK